MPQYGFLTSAIHSIPRQVEAFARAGCDYVEIGIEEPLATPALLQRQKSLILNSIKKNGIFAIGHTAYWVEFGSSHRKVREGWIEEAKDMINAAHALRIKLLNFHFMDGHGQSMETDFGKRIFLKNFTAAMRELVSFSKRKKITLMLENTPKNEDRIGIKEFSRVIRNAPGLMVHLDIAHAFIEGGMQRINDYINRFPRQIAHIHVHDNHGKYDEHLPPGDGSINFKDVVQWLKAINYERTITFEVFTSQKDALKSLKAFRTLWGEK